MAGSRSRGARLQDRDFAILEHIMRYRVSTRDILHRKFFADSEPNAATKVTSRLVETKYLTRYPLVATQSYYTLGVQGAKVFGLPITRLGALGPQSLYTQLGILSYCHTPNATRQRLRVAELQEKHPGLLAKGVDSSQYAVDSTTTPTVLIHVRVDGGGPADHVMRKLKEDLKIRQQIALCRALIEKQRFGLAVVTYTDAKKQQILQRIQSEEWPCAIQLEVCPILLQLQSQFE